MKIRSGRSRCVGLFLTLSKLGIYKLGSVDPHTGMTRKVSMEAIESFAKRVISGT